MAAGSSASTKRTERPEPSCSSKKPATRQPCCSAAAGTSSSPHAGRSATEHSRIDSATYPSTSSPARSGTPAWNRTTVLTGDAAEEVSALRDRTAGDILVYASFQLVDELILRRLVDEVRLLVHPVALGTGRRLFEPPADIPPLLRAGVRRIGTNLVLLSYAPDGPARG